MFDSWLSIVLVVAALAVALAVIVVVAKAAKKRRPGAEAAATRRREGAGPLGGAHRDDGDGDDGGAATATKSRPRPADAELRPHPHEVTGTWPYDEPVETAPDDTAPAETPPGETLPGAASPDGAALVPAELPEAKASRLTRLRAKLAGSSSGLGRALLTILSRDKLTDEDWDELEEALLIADVGAEATGRIVDEVRRTMRVENSSSTARARELLRAQLIDELQIPASRDLALHGETDPETGAARPGVMLVVGVNGSGKTTTIGRIARLAVAEGTSVLLGAADTFRAAAAEQLTTWGERVGVDVVRGPEGSDPASVAFDAVKQGIERGVDCVIVDTAGRLQNKTNLMSELGKIVKVAGRQAPITETLLVLDATTGQNGLNQGRVFADVANVTGIVLTKLDGSAKGGVVIAVQKELGVPVKLVGLGEGPDDLAPFVPEQFVDALLEA